MNTKKSQSLDFKDKIFFYCYPQGPPQKAAYQHSIISIAEGLKELGIIFVADRNYWKLSPTKEIYLFRYNSNIKPNDCDVVVLNDVWFSYGLGMPKDLFAPKRKYITVYVDSADSLYTQSLRNDFRKFDIILRTHMNKKLKYPSNFKPWAFGLTKRIIEYTKDNLIYEKRDKRILNNFRVPHQVREIANKSFFPRISDLFTLDSTSDGFYNKHKNPYENMLWEQTGRRHYSTYYQKLTKTAFCSCFGGMFVVPFPKDISNNFSKIANFWNQRTVKYGMKTNVITQYDSWRFWEALASGCIAIHVDLKKYGAFLPIMPENFRHYIGVDFDDIDKTRNKIENNISLLPLVSDKGRKWALEEYSPKAVAQRFLQYIIDFKIQKES